jgi:hypothetical protein
MVVIMCELNSQFIQQANVRVMCRATCKHISNRIQTKMREKTTTTEGMSYHQ